MSLINGIAAGSDQNVGLLDLGAQRYRAYLGETLVYGERDLTLPPGAGKILTNAANPIVVSEGLQTSFTVWLDRRPLSSVRLDITLAEHPRDPITLVTSARMRFTRGNWNTPQTVTIEANDVPDVTDLYTSLTITGPEDQILNSVSRRIRIRNDDLLVPRLELDKTSLELGAGGDMDTFRARLTVFPSADVTVAFSALTNASTSPTSLTFTPAFADVWQTVAVTSGANTGMETLTLTPSGGGVDGVAKAIDISVTGKPQVSISPDSLTLLEGETKEIQVRVVNAPEDYVVLVRVDEISPLIYAGPQILTFTDTRSQVVRVTALEDVLTGDQDGAAQVRFILSGAGDNFTKVLPVAVVNTGASPLLDVSPTYLPIDAESTAAVAVKLTNRPYADVTVSATLPTRAGTLSASELTFTRDNWNTAQELTITAVALAVGANDVLAELTLTGSGGGVADTATVSILVASSAAVQNTLVVSNTAVSIAAGDTTRVTVSLNRPPVLGYTLGQPMYGVVTVALASSDSADVAVSPASMTFDEDDWDSLKQVTLSADANASGEMATITLTPSGGGSDEVVKQVVASVQAAEMRVPRFGWKNAKADFLEPGGPYIEELTALSSAPSAPVTVVVKKATVAELRAIGFPLTSNPIVLQGDPVTLRFDENNYSSGLPLSIRAPAGATQPYALLRDEVTEGTLASPGGFLTVHIQPPGFDDVRPHIHTTGISMSENETVTVGVSLQSKPDNNITVRVTEQSTLLSVGGATLTFTPQNWDTRQNVTLMGLTPPSPTTMRRFNLYAYASGQGASPEPAVVEVEVLPASTVDAPIRLTVAYGELLYAPADTAQTQPFRETFLSWEGPPEVGTTVGFTVEITGPFSSGVGLGGLDSRGNFRLYYQTSAREELYAGYPYTATVTRWKEGRRQASETLQFIPPNASGSTAGAFSSSSGPRTPVNFNVAFGSRRIRAGVAFVDGTFSWGKPSNVNADSARYVLQYSGPFGTTGGEGRDGMGTRNASASFELYAGEAYTASVYVDGLSDDAATLSFTTPS